MKSITVKISDEGLQKLDAVAKYLSSGRSAAFRFVLDKFSLSGVRTELVFNQSDKKGDA